MIVAPGTVLWNGILSSDWSRNLTINYRVPVGFCGILQYLFAAPIGTSSGVPHVDIQHREQRLLGNNSVSLALLTSPMTPAASAPVSFSVLDRPFYFGWGVGPGDFLSIRLSEKWRGNFSGDVHFSFHLMLDATEGEG